MPNKNFVDAIKISIYRDLFLVGEQYNPKYCVVLQYWSSMHQALEKIYW